MRKYLLLIVVTLLCSLSSLLAQVVWDNSSCVYSVDNRKSELISKQDIATGSLVFYRLNNQLVFEKLDNLGNPITDQVIDLNIQVNEESILTVRKSYDNNFFIYWREENLLKIKKISEEGSDLWNSCLNIPILDYSNRIIDGMQIVDDEESVYLLVNYQSDVYEEVLVSYQIDVINNNPQEINQNIIYEAEGLSSFTGALTSDGITYMWLQADEDKIFIKISETIHEINGQVAYSTQPGWKVKECKILELNGDKTLYCLVGKYYESYNEGFSDIYIYNEVTESTSEVFTNQILIDVQRISDNEFLSVTMSDSLYFTRYDAVGDIISSVSQEHYCHGWSQDWISYQPYIKSVDCRLENGEYKIAIGFIGVSSDIVTPSTDYNSKLGIYSYNLANDQTSAVLGDLGNFTENRISLYVCMGDTRASLLNKCYQDNDSSYNQYFLDYNQNSQVSHNTYQIALTSISYLREMNSFIWNGNSRVIMKVNNSLLENEINDIGEIIMENYQETNSPMYILENFSENNYVLLYAYNYDYFDDFGVTEVTYDVRAKFYKDNGSISIEDMPCESNLQSYLDIEDGDGLWMTPFYSSSFQIRRIENGVLQDPIDSWFEYGNILMVKNNYLIKNGDHQFLITKINDFGSITEGWTLDGYSFTEEYDINIRNKEIFKYQNRLIFSYLTGANYKILDVNPEDLAQTTSYVFPCTYINEKNDFIIGNKFYNIHNYDSQITISCYDIDNNFAEVWQESVAENVRDYDIKVVNNRFVVAYTQGTEGSERVYLRTISFLGNSDQYEEGYALPLNLDSQYDPTISVLDDNTIFVNRIENNSADNPGVYCDLIDLSYFVPNNTENVSPLTFTATNYPNPFNPETTISYNLTKAGVTKVEVFNLKGQLVKTLVNEVQAQGNQKVIWKGNNNQDKQVSSGIYLYKIKSTGGVISGKMVLMK